MYISMVGSLLYATTIRTTILQDVGVVGIFQYAPKETNMKEVKRIFRYLKGILKFGLWFQKIEDFTLTAYTNAYWASSLDDKKSTSGGEIYLGKCMVPWLSKNNTSISLSTTDA
jgi:hypothetical protein